MFGNLVYTVAAFIIALGVLIAVHEYGHYLVARLCGVKVLRFSLGFGRPLFVRRFGRDQTEWAVSAIPLGGFVRMLDEREAPVAPEELHRAFNRQSVAKRFAIVSAGPIANFLLAITLYWGLFIVGVPGMKPILGEPAKGTVAAVAGFHNGDTLTRVADRAVSNWQDVRWALLEHAVARDSVTVEAVQANGGKVERRLDLSAVGAGDLDGEFLVRLGLTQYRPPVPPLLGAVMEGGVAQRAGLKVGDLVLKVDGKAVPLWENFVDVVRAHPEKPVEMLVQRDGREIAVTVTPARAEENGVAIGRIGAGPKVDEAAWKHLSTEVRYGPVDALTQAVRKTWETSVVSLQMLGKMLVGEVSWRNISGPITIADYAGQTAHLGAVPYISFLALISISLGVLNLLPIPLLDGGHLMYYSVELLKGSPVSERVMEIGQQLGMALLIVLMLFAFYNDINRLLSG